MKQRPGWGTEPADFLLLAIEGMEHRLEAQQNQLNALREAAERAIDGLAGGPPTPKRGRGRPPKARNAPAGLLGPATGHPTASTATDKAGRKRAAWTPQMKAAAAERMRKVNQKRWKELKRAQRAKTKAGTERRGWTPEQRARLSESMKKARARKPNWRSK